MALFDFLKSKEQREQEKVFQELTDQIFPGGKTQIEEEVKEIRIAIDYRYPKDEIYKAYLHAACLFYVSDDKSEERIINSMLNHENSVLSKGDAKNDLPFFSRKIRQGTDERSGCICLLKNEP